ncbi:hypothetical protein EDD18DRAFT_1186731, partial [Armillaria luteobubalina]
MAWIDPHLMLACDVSIDVDPTLLTLLERVQKLFLRRLLVAPLFSETGMWPIRYRRIMLALRYWQYALSLPNDHFLSYAFRDSLALAQGCTSSWKAVVRLLSSSHALAIEVLRWADCHQPAVPRAQHWCCFCHSNIEDKVHALWFCDASQVVRDLRTCFSRDIVSLTLVDFLQHLRSALTVCHVIGLFSDTEHDTVVCCFAKYVHDILKVFGEIP